MQKINIKGDLVYETHTLDKAGTANSNKVGFKMTVPDGSGSTKECSVSDIVDNDAEFAKKLEEKIQTCFTINGLET